jgi:hypothetical protein
VEDLLQVLTKFHREVVAPDLQRIFDGLRIDVSARFAEIRGRFDGIHRRLDRIEPCEALACVRRIEERLDRIEVRLDRMALPSLTKP